MSVGFHRPVVKGRQGQGVVSSVPMLKRLLLPVLAALFAVAPAIAAPRAGTVPEAAEPLQFYVFSFTDTPASEATDIVSGALAHDLEIDPAVDAIVTFRADGWYSEEALLRDFGTALLDEDVVLVRTGAGAYALAPRVNAPMLTARGGVVLRLQEPKVSRPPSGPNGDQRTAPVPPVPPWWDGVLWGMSLFSIGAAAGAAAVVCGKAVWRRSQAAPIRQGPVVLRLTHARPQPLPEPAPKPDPELVIPDFANRR
jgi:hypothetical protein